MNREILAILEQDPAELEHVLGEHRGQAAVLRHNGHELQARAKEQVCDDVAGVMRDYLDWLSEDEAHLRSGWGTARLRRMFPIWQEARMAKTKGEGRRVKRFYRRCIVPQRPNTAVHYEAGRRAS